MRAVILRCAGNNFFTGADINEFSGPPEGRRIPGFVGEVRRPEGPSHSRDAWLLDRRRARNHAGLPLPHCNADREVHVAGGDAGHHSRGRWHATAAASRRPAKCAAHDSSMRSRWMRPRRSSWASSTRSSSGDLAAAHWNLRDSSSRTGAGPRRTSERSVDPREVTPGVHLPVAGRSPPDVPQSDRGAHGHRIRASHDPDAIRGRIAVRGKARQPDQGHDSKREDRYTCSSRSARAARLKGLPTGVALRRSIGGVGVVGAGTMGGGIAIAFANAGIPVTLLDVTQDSLTRGLSRWWIAPSRAW